MAVWIEMGDRRYEYVTLSDLSLWQMIEIKKQTGLGVGQVEELMLDFGQVGEPGARFASFSELLGSEEHLLAMAVQLWAARVAAGDEVTIREAASVPMSQWRMVDDDEHPEEQPDPTGPAGSGDAAAG